MSLLTRILNKNTPSPGVDAPSPPEPRPVPPPKVDAATLAQEEAQVQQAVAAGDAAALGRLAVQGSSTRVRQAAATAVTDPEQVRELMRAVKGHDKNVYRILTAKRDGALARERAAQARREEVLAAAAAIARHADRAVDSSYAPRLAHMQARWTAAAADASPEEREAVAADLARASAALSRHERAAAAAAEQQRASAAAAAAARRQEEEATSAAALAAAHLAAEQAARDAEQGEAERVQQAATAAAVSEMTGLLRQAQAALERGGSARAARLREDIAAKLPQAPPLPAWYERKLQEFDARVAELKDWKTFTVVPKRAELLRRMQALIGADMAPEELARQIRRLRDEWRTLHRGAGNEPAAEDAPFEQAAALAFEPCRHHFAEQSARREQNAARREALLERLGVFAAGVEADERPDWRLVQQALGEARREWREAAPVNPAVIESLQSRFHAVIERLRSGLDAEYARNVEAKQRIIARAAELETLPDSRQAIDEAKQLQRAWKDVGIVPHRQSDKLWQAFRRHCDVVFERSSQEAAARDAVRQAGQLRATQLCTEVEAIADAPPDALTAGLERLSAAQAEFDTIELPRDAVRELRRRFGRAVERCEDASRRQRAAAMQRGRDDFFAAAARLQACAAALGGEQAVPRERIDALQAAAAQAVSAAGNVPKPVRAGLERALARLVAADFSRDTAANEAGLRLLCVRSELMAGIDSPAEDAELRRELQMQRLAASMGGDRQHPDALALALEWVAAGPTGDEVYAALLKRFRRAWEALPA
ncbi:MAG: DUF349 domain-containing protein [Steroidobacteraceae bacterium]